MNTPYTMSHRNGQLDLAGLNGGINYINLIQFLMHCTKLLLFSFSMCMCVNCILTILVAFVSVRLSVWSTDQLKAGYCVCSVKEIFNNCIVSKNGLTGRPTDRRPQQVAMDRSVMASLKCSSTLIT